MNGPRYDAEARQFIEELGDKATAERTAEQLRARRAALRLVRDDGTRRA
jgi:hypothetical protein